jgi:uncharacterized protein YggE
MRSAVRWLVSSAIVAMVAVATVAPLPFATNIAQAQSEPTGSLPRTITVVGEGTVSISPDVARANIGVEVARPTVKEASEENKAVVEAVLAALEEQGIDESDIQTSGFSVYAERFGPEGPLSENEVQYRMSNNVSVTIRDLDSVGAVLDAAIDAGANNIYGVEFSLEDMGAAQSEARADAVADAGEKAAQLAELVDVSLGEVISLSEVIGSNGGFYSGLSSRVQGLGGGGGAPISPGELEIVQQIQAVYAIE